MPRNTTPVSTTAPGAPGRRCSAPTAAKHRTAYDRARDLPALIAVWPHEINDDTTSAHAVLIAKLRRALRRERQHGIAGHWTYDLQRHAALLRAYRSEVETYLSRRGNRSIPGSLPGT